MAGEKKPKKENKLAKDAMKIAKKMAAKNNLDLAEILSDTQKRAAKLIGEGNTIQEVARMSSVGVPTVEAWMEKPAFLAIVNESTKNTGFAEKSFRIRATKRLLQEVNQRMFDKISELDDMGFEKLHKIMLDLTSLMQRETEEKTINVGGDFSVMIVNHFKSKGVEVSSLDEVFERDAEKFPTIDAEFEELGEDEQ